MKTIEERLLLCAELAARTTGACDGGQREMEVSFRYDVEEFVLRRGATEYYRASTLEELCDGYINRARGELVKLQAKAQADWDRRQATIQALL
jgi:hypothetical protein